MAMGLYLLLSINVDLKFASRPINFNSERFVILVPSKFASLPMDCKFPRDVIFEFSKFALPLIAFIFLKSLFSSMPKSLKLNSLDGCL